MKILSLLFISISTLLCVAQNSVQLKIDAFGNDPSLQNAGVSFKAINLEDGSTIAEYNGRMAMPPASTVKLFSTATAFEVLGSFYKPKTRIYFDGDLDSNGVLNGNVLIRGGGDPTLGSRFFEKRGEEGLFMKAWADTIKKLGVKEITGAVIADGYEFGYNGVPAGWTWGDMGNYYGSGPAGCTLYDNMVYLQFNSGSKVGDTVSLACTIPYIPNYSLDNYVTTASSKKDNSYIYGAPYLNERFIRGKLPVNANHFEVKGSIPDPEYLMAVELAYALSEVGINSKKAPIGFKTLMKTVNHDNLYKSKSPVFEYEGKSLKTIAYHTNMRSVNLFAEQLLCLTALKKYGSGSTSEGAAFLNSFWTPKVGSSLRITDGSGLSRNNAVSAHHYVQLLQYMSKSKNAKDFKETLPVAGKSGTLSRVCRGQAAHGRIYAKSGTMSKIKSYAGYVDSKSGKKIAFAIIVNNHLGYTSSLVKKMEKVFNAMAIY